MRSLAIILAALASACGGGSMGMTSVQPIRAAPEQQLVVDDAQVAQELARRPQLPENARIGVYFRAPQIAEGETPWRWTYDERRDLAGTADSISGVQMFAMSDSLVSGTDLPSLRVAAARHGADAILIVDGALEQRTSENGWSAMYALLLPVLFAPGQDLESTFRAHATLFDVRNGFLYMTAESEAVQNQERAHVWIDRHGASEAVRAEAIGYLVDELTHRFEQALQAPSS